MVNRCLAKMANRQVAGAFERWLELVDIHRRERAVATKALRHMATYKVGAAFRGWGDRVAQRNEQRAKVRRSLAALANRTLHAAFGGWAATWEELKRQRALVQRCLRKLASRTLAGAFAKWADEVLDAREASRAAAKAEKFLLGLRNRSLFRAFGRWAEMGRELRRHRRLVHRSLARLANRLLAASFGHWAFLVGEKREAARKTRLKFTVALNFYSSNLYRKAFALWRRNVRQASRRDRYMRAVGGRILRRHFDDWLGTTATNRARRVLLAKIMHRTAHRFLSFAFLQWCRFIARRRRLAHTFRKALKRMDYFKAKGALEAWKAWRAARAQERAFAGKFRARSAKRRQGAVLLHWRKAVRVAAWERRVLADADARRRLRTARRAFQGWARAARRERAEGRRLADAAGIFGRVYLRASFAVWRQAGLAGRVRDAQLVQMVAMQRGSNLLVRALQAWRDAAAGAQEEDGAVVRGFHAEADRLRLKGGLRALGKHARKSKARRNRTRRAAADVTAQAFSKWKLFASFHHEPRAAPGPAPGAAQADLSLVYDKVLRECEQLEQKVLELESQRMDEYGAFAYDKLQVDQEIAKNSEATAAVLQQLADENRMLQAELGELAA